MQFSNVTRINPEAVADSIPIIHGQNYYIDEQGYVSTYNIANEFVFDVDGYEVNVTSIKPVTEFIYIINNKVAYRTTLGFLVTELDATKENYRGGFQGIVGFNETETEYQYINSNSSLKSEIKYTGRINSSKQLEIYIANIEQWIVPLGEFRCFINNTLYTITYDTVLPNSFGETFDVILLGWTTVNLSLDTNYIRDIFVAGNTLYLSTRLQIIGSTPYDWSSINTETQTVIWSEDSRLTGCYFAGKPTSSYFFLVNYNTSSIYWVSAEDFSILQEYQHSLPILGVGAVDKFTLGIVDKEALTILSAYVSLNTWLIKIRTYFKFNQLSAYEEMTTQYLREDVTFVQELNTLVVKSTQRASMLFHILDNKVLSGCHTESEIIAGDYGAFLVKDKTLYRYLSVDDSGEYNPIDVANGIINFDSFIYIGSDLEPDVGGSTMRDTEILFEGKIALVDGDDVSVESSGDVPADTTDLPVRTQQINSDNWWYLYTKTLRYPISYTDWIKISLMPTTKIFNISLVGLPEDNKPKKKSKSK